MSKRPFIFNFVEPISRSNDSTCLGTQTRTDSKEEPDNDESSNRDEVPDEVPADRWG